MELLKAILILVIGFVLLIKGADFFVEGSSSVAKKFHVPAMLIGMTIVAMGTSLPECAVSVTASLANNNSLAVSNVIGSNIFNLMVVCGACALFSPLMIRQDTLKKEFPLSIICAALMLVLGYIGMTLGHIDGIIFLVLFVGYLLWMMPENAAFARRYDVKTCLQNAKVYLADVGFGEMEPCFVQQYDGMAVANFAAVQDGVTLYPDQVKVQVSMDSGRVVGAECSQYLANHTRRTDVTPTVTAALAREMVSPKLTIRSERLCVIPLEAGEALCWGFSCTDGAADYWVFVNAKSGETEQLLRVIATEQGEAAM